MKNVEWETPRFTHYHLVIIFSNQSQGKCGVAVVRISGGEALEALRKMTNLTKPEPRKAFLRKIFDPQTGEIIDRGLCLWFPGPNSFTGEDSVEFQVHGGPAILESLMSALAKLEFRAAESGEFTRRAFFNDKLDLTEVEGLADLIDAETEQQRKLALLQADGSLSKLYKKWRESLAQSVANLEAYIDFSEDDNIESDVLNRCNETLRDLSLNIKTHLSDGRKGEILRNGIRTVIIGEPNVGKSSLLNYLVQRNAAIVTPIAGTTRDIVELNTNISGYPILLADTAGLAKATTDVVEQEGIRRAKIYANNADFVILMADATVYLNSRKPYEEYVRDYIENLELKDLLLKKGVLAENCVVVMNKADLLNDQTKERLRADRITVISCAKEEGFQEFLETMTHNFQKICGNPSRENPTISQNRHRIHLIKCVEHLENYFELSSTAEYDMVLAVQEIRNSMRELGKITGHVSAEQILDIIFKTFCIGK
ncbi:tRNA modification GTPase GTPBP3, mitochondrial isoform X2 [Cephus cinctus]|uniref:tRNA modification GTPase GTPBP3, mitochondrial isoform X2 n=1 Tax=Cephus cinctus TaxID=211228 RepID=A0AAJ7RUA5_CEPCN|nr:tRNA modification GTPase GTPBP3, mitochondrial isoform X2 [Cephus cinctus]XP_024946819.1 tRNA modification GTPase GTPBP3, mitochondrial isoform X2 [Cephus cinctus]